MLFPGGTRCRVGNANVSRKNLYFQNTYTCSRYDKLYIFRSDDKKIFKPFFIHSTPCTLWNYIDFNILFDYIFYLLLTIILSFLFAENKSILTDSDWKKLWMEAGSVNPSSKTDNTIDSSDSPVFDDNEVCVETFFLYFSN